MMVMLQRQEGKMLNAKKAFKVTVVRLTLVANSHRPTRRNWTGELGRVGRCGLAIIRFTLVALAVTLVALAQW